jgi:exopolysaccharide biosynthesis polyprenyl glycosylphosphotransferase
LPALGMTRWSQAFRHAPPLEYVIAVWLLLALWAGVYRVPCASDRWSRLVRAVHASIAVACAVIIASFISAEIVAGRSRGLALLVTPISFVLFNVSSVGSCVLAAALSKYGSSRRGVAVLGFDEEAVSILEHLRISELDCVKGLILPEGRSLTCVNGNAPILGTTKELASVINREGLHRIVMLNGSLSENELEVCSGIATRMGVTVSCAVAVAAPTRSLAYSVYSGIPLVEIQPVFFTAAERLVKRLFDIVGSSVLLILLAPLMALIAFLVKASSDGPILFKAPRVGRGGRYFNFLKFRTMHAGSSRLAVISGNEKDGHLFKIKDDPRVTPIGRLLRRYSLDELPQLINVLLGEMSLVGPRPLPIEDMEPDGMSQKFAIWSEQRASVPPGITGLWQIRGRSELPFTDLVKYDLEYVHNWSLGLDFKILFSTPGFVLTGKGAF